jgi:transposase
MNKRYIVRLSDEERQQLLALTSRGKAATYKIKHANILLQVDAGGPHQADHDVAKTFHCHVNTVRNVRQRFVEQGLEAALARKPQEQPSRQSVLDGSQEAHLIALRCGEPPEGHSKWTLRLLADQLVALDIVESISHETVRQALKKTLSNRTCKSAG